MPAEPLAKRDSGAQLRVLAAIQVLEPLAGRERVPVPVPVPAQVLVKVLAQGLERGLVLVLVLVQQAVKVLPPAQGAATVRPPHL